MTEQQELELFKHLAHLDSCIDQLKLKVDYGNKSIDELRAGIYKTVLEHDQRIPVMEDRINELRKYAWFFIFTISAQAVAYVFRK